MRINVRRDDGLWFLADHGSLERDCFKALSDALYEATLRSRLAGRDGSASLSIRYDELPNGSGWPTAELVAAP